MKYIIVGGVAGGASFVCRLRRLSEEAKIVIYEKSHFISYANCGLPYYVSSVIFDSHNLTLQTPESLKARFNILVHVDNEVLSIDRKRHTVKVKDLETGEIFEDGYDKLILSPGAEAIHLTEDTDRIFQLKTVEDAVSIRSFLEKSKVKEAIVIGGGFIGLEIAENLVHAGVHVTLIEGRYHVLNTLDEEMASFVHSELRKNNISLKLETRVEKIEEKGKQVIVRTDKGECVSDILVQAVGVLPSSKLAKDCGLELDIRGTIRTDKNFRTSDPDIYAIGDAIALDSALDNSRTHIALAGLANKEGRELANALLQKKEADIRPYGTSILKIFHLSVGAVGFTEEPLRKKGIPYDKVYLAQGNHASHYPGATTLRIKLLFGKEDYQILGAQIVGQEGVDKRIDVLSTAMVGKIPACGLKKLELSYAPPFSSAKDPVNVLGLMVENIKDGLVRQFFHDEVERIASEEDVLLVDVRTPMEYEMGHIPNSINIPVDQLRQRYPELPKEKKIALICESALRSYVAYRFLSQLGYSCRHLAGGYRLYRTWLDDRKEKEAKA